MVGPSDTCCHCPESPPEMRILSLRWVSAAAIGLMALSATALPAPVFAATPAKQVISQFNDALLATMKAGKTLGYAGRVTALSQPVANTYDMSSMTLVILGAAARALPPADQAKIADAFTRFTVATYADQFSDYSGEKFEVGNERPSVRGMEIVPTKLIPGSGDTVELDYLMRPDAAGDWRVVDVLIGGTISQVAVRRSELLSLFRDKGVDGLVAALDAKTASLSQAQ